VAVPATDDGPFLDRFSGFADLYDSQRPSAPARLGPLLARYAGVERPVVVDLGSGTGLSSRWAAGWAGRVFATIDADWPPVTGLASAEEAWVRLHGRIRVFEARLAAGDEGAHLRRAVHDDDPALVDDDPRDPHLNRVMPGGRSWPKREHLANIERSGHFAYARELVLDDEAGGGADRFVALLRSQGSYQGLVKAGLTDDDLGVPAFERLVADAYAAAAGAVPLSFCWRVRLGRRPT
jgi:hypothetical protein